MPCTLSSPAGLGSPAGKQHHAAYMWLTQAVRAGVRPPSVQGAHDLLLQALQDQCDWERRARQSKELLNEMVGSRREAAQLSQQYDIKCVFSPMPACCLLDLHAMACCSAALACPLLLTAGAACKCAC